MEEVEQMKKQEVREVVIIVAVGEEKVEEVEVIKSKTMTMKRQLSSEDVLVNAVLFTGAANLLVLSIWGACQIPKAKSSAVVVVTVVLLGVGSLLFTAIWLNNLAQIISTRDASLQ